MGKVKVRESFLRPVTGATTLLAWVCFFDTFYTLWAVRSGIAQESNPLMRALLNHGDYPFLIIKGLLFLVPLATLELLRPLSPRFINGALRLGAASYLVMYGVGSFIVHRA